MLLIDRLLSRLERGELPPVGSTLIVGVSGGVDSMGLLHLLVLLANKYNWRLIIAHLNHQLRRRAINDENWVRGVGSRLGLPVVTTRVAVKALAQKHKYTLEEAGRIARYDFFNRLAKRYRARAIVVAHTADDQVETVIMNWLRGAGVRGLVGMSEWQGNVWRPLLRVAKADLKQMAQILHFGYREDETNRQLIYTRNRIRHRVLPTLRKVNPQIDEVIVRNAENLAGLEDLLDVYLAQARKATHCRRGRGLVSCRLSAFNKVHPYLQNELLLWMVREVRGDGQGYKTVHLSEMRKVINSQNRTSYRQLPGKLFLIKAYDKISVSQFKPKDL